MHAHTHIHMHTITTTTTTTTTTTIHLVVASFSPFFQSQITMLWLSSRPTDASRFPSAETNMHGTTKPANQTTLWRMTVTGICNNGSRQFTYTPTVLSLSLFSLPWYNHPGWLGIKHQVTYFFCFQPINLITHKHKIQNQSRTNTKFKINSFFKHDLPMLNMCLLSDYESNVYMYVWSKSYHKKLWIWCKHAWITSCH